MKKPRLSGSLDYMSGGSGGDRRKSASGSLTFSGERGSITPGFSYSKDTYRQQSPDGVVVDEFGRRIGISVGGELFLDEAGDNRLRAGASRDVMTGGYEASSGEEDAYKQALERYFLGLDLGPLSMDVNKAGDDVSGRAAYRAGENMEFSVEDSNRGDPTFGFQFAKQFNDGGPVAAEELERAKMERQLAQQMQALYEEDLAARGGAPRARTAPQKAGPLDLGVGLKERLAFLNQTFNPVEAIGQSMGAGERLLSGDVEGYDRLAALGDMLSGIAGIAFPALAAGRAGIPATKAATETLLGFSAAPQAAADEVVPENDFYKFLTGQIDAPTPSTLPPPPQAVSLPDELFSTAPLPESSNPIGPRAGVGPARPSDSAAEALGFKDTVYHSTLSPEEFTQFDLKKEATGYGRSFQDHLGVHVGTPKAAEQRYLAVSQSAEGYDANTPPEDRVVYNPKGFTMELRARTDNPLTKEKFAKMLGVPVERLFNNVEGPITERDFSSMMQSYGAHLDRRNVNYKYTPEGVATLLRRDLADKGFTHIPYVNSVEDKGSTSFIMLTDRDGRSPAVLRDVRAQFDPSKINDPDLRFSDGGSVDPDDFYSRMNSVDVFALR